jgi:hypothetical protein
MISGPSSQWTESPHLFIAQIVVGLALLVPSIALQAPMADYENHAFLTLLVLAFVGACWLTLSQMPGSPYNLLGMTSIGWHIIYRLWFGVGPHVVFRKPSHVIPARMADHVQFVLQADQCDAAVLSWPLHTCESQPGPGCQPHHDAQCCDFQHHRPVA